MFEIILMTVLGMLSIGLFLCFLRAVIGPTMSDRIVALDMFGILLVGFIGIVMILKNTLVYADAFLIISIAGFIGSISLSKFIERGEILDAD